MNGSDPRRDFKHNPWDSCTFDTSNPNYYGRRKRFTVGASPDRERASQRRRRPTVGRADVPRGVLPAGVPHRGGRPLVISYLALVGVIGSWALGIAVGFVGHLIRQRRATI